MEIPTNIMIVYSIVAGETENHDMTCDVGIDDEGNVLVMPSDNENPTEGPSDEASMILEVVSECITSLFRTGILIRRAGPTDRFKRALQMSTSTFPASFDVDYVREKHPKIKGRNEELAERLGDAISKRRQFIKYSRDHRTRLGYDEPGDTHEVRPARTEQISSKASSFYPEKLPESPLLPITVEEEEDKDAVSVISASTFSDATSNLKLPRLEDLSTDGEPFECPICFTLQSFRWEKAWR